MVLSNLCAVHSPSFSLAQLLHKRNRYKNDLDASKPMKGNINTLAHIRAEMDRSDGHGVANDSFAKPTSVD